MPMGSLILLLVFSVESLLYDINMHTGNVCTTNILLQMMQCKLCLFYIVRFASKELLFGKYVTLCLEIYLNFVSVE